MLRHRVFNGLMVAALVASLAGTGCDEPLEDGADAGAQDGATLDAQSAADVTPDLACHGDMSKTCYSGPSGTQKVGQCKAGLLRCSAGAWDTKCVGQVTPTKETCDGKDNDCDGLPDEGLARYCYTGPTGTSGVGQCQQGLQVCASAKWGACVGQVKPAASEACDNKDNDCDGKTDEDVSATCYTGAAATKGVGLCKPGTKTCTAGKWGECSGQVKPKTEACDNKDNDCNGKTDDALTQSCYSGPASTKGKGVCKAGNQTCAAGKWSGCVGQVLPSSEKCNDNKDNDCDGKTDDQQDCYTGPPATLGVGVCKGGKEACVIPVGPTPNVGGVCQGEVTPSNHENDCNDNKDNDCDGKTDGQDPDCRGD